MLPETQAGQPERVAEPLDDMLVRKKVQATIPHASPGRLPLDSQEQAAVVKDIAKIASRMDATSAMYFYKLMVSVVPCDEFAPYTTYISAKHATSREVLQWICKGMLVV